MAPRHLSNLPAVRKQQLLIEFSSLKYACPHGVFMSLTPGDPTLWSGVLFIRKGPYAPSILRFQIAFPATYPSLPPLVTFSTDMFHPLITPLTTYMYTTDTQTSAEGTVSATDEQRLPPGGFSLRAGFPGWFGGGRGRNPLEQSTTTSTSTPGGNGASGLSSPGSAVSEASSATAGGPEEEIGIYELLRYVRSTFDDAAVLDAVPLEAAGNPGAWHAWRTHRVKSGHVLPTSPSPVPAHDGQKSDGEVPEGYKSLAGGGGVVGQRRPGEWNWDGVWEVRVRKGVDNSVAEAVLFGKEAGDDLIRFLNLDEGEVGAVMASIRENVEGVKEDAQRRAVA